PGQLRPQVQGGCAALLRLRHSFRRPRRDDPEQGFVLRDRPRGEGQMGHPGAALPLEMVGARDAAGGAHAADLRRPDRGDGRTRAGASRARRRQGDRAGRQHHPRGGRGDDGRRSAHLGGRSVVPQLGRGQPVPGRRIGVPFERRQEPDPDDHGERLARRRPHPRRHAPQGALMDRRTTIKWMFAAATTLPLGGLLSPFAAEAAGKARPYGSDPKLLELYHPGELWPLTLTPEQRRIATILADTIIPADETSPSASAVGVVDFLDEWISAPYPTQKEDRHTVL